MQIYNKQLNRLLKKIPSDPFECIPGCSDCCRYFQCSWTEWERIPEKRLAEHRFAPCPYLTKTGICEIYEMRPMICRIFGLVTEYLPNIPRIHHIRLMCKRGVQPKIKLTNKELRDLFLGMMDLQNKEAADTLNECGGQDYIKPVPAGPYGWWIWDEIKQRSREMENANGLRSVSAGSVACAANCGA